MAFHPLPMPTSHFHPLFCCNSPPFPLPTSFQINFLFPHTSSFIFLPNCSFTFFLLWIIHLLTFLFSSLCASIHLSFASSSHIYIYIYYTRKHSRHRWVSAHQRQGKSEKKGTRHRACNTQPHHGHNWCAHRGWRVEQKTEGNKKEKQGVGPQPRYPGPFSRLLRRAYF